MLLTERRIKRRLDATRAHISGNSATTGGGADSSLLSSSTTTTTNVDTSTTTDIKPSSAVPGSVREVGLPRLEVLAERLCLDAFEKRMILLLIGKWR
jgi:hypothetical protein